MSQVIYRKQENYFFNPTELRILQITTLDPEWSDVILKEAELVVVTCVGGGGQVVEVSVDGGQVVDDVSAQAALLQHAAAAFVDGVLTLALGSEHAVALNKVQTQVHFGAGVREAAGAVWTTAFVVVQTHLREEETCNTG